MSVREYVGARYVPVFADPVEWDDTRAYEPLTIVYYQGNSYTSRQAVPVGIPITNETFWALTGNYNAQIEQYRAEVQTFDGRIEDNTDDISDIKANNWVTTSRIANGAVTYDKLAAALKKKLKTDTAIRNECVLMLGDSYAQGVAAQDTDHNGNNWQDLLTSMLGLTDVYKYKAGSAGFVMTSTSTSGSSSTVPTGTTYNQVLNYAYEYINGLGRADEVKHIIIQGGWNDSNMTNFNATTIRDAAVTCILNLRSKFPNAKIYIVATFCGSIAKSGNSQKTEVARAYQRACSRYGCSFADCANLPWLFETASYDTVHPTNEMQNHITGFIAQLLMFGYAYDYEGIAANGIAFINSNHELVYRKRHNCTVESGTNIIVPANERCGFGNYLGNQDVPNGLENVTDSAAGMATVRYYVNGQIKIVFAVQSSGSLNGGDEINIFLNHVIKFHG